MPSDPRARRPFALAVAGLVLAAAAVASATDVASGAPTGTARIYNGHGTADFPAVVLLDLALDSGERAACSGTLIAANVVLTAAHCLSIGPTSITAVFFPDGFTPVPAEAAQVDGLPDVRIHPAFDFPRNDIGLVFLAADVSGIAPMSLAASTPRARTRATIVGYGDDPTGRMSPKQRGMVRLVHCPRAFRAARLAPGQLADSLCWRPKRHGQDTCQGDSGGPLVVGDAVAGITSGGFPNCPGRLSWDTNVALYRDWVLSEIAR